MSVLNSIFSAATRLQASRSFMRDLRGLGSSHEGREFAKALSTAASAGASPQEVVEEVIKAMGGNQRLAFELLEGVEKEVAKSHVEHHTRTLANGKTVGVKDYETARTAAMKHTTLAHGATFHAMRTKTAEAHDNAAAAHEEAATQHGKAHELHPMDLPETGQEHAKLKGGHQQAVAYHQAEAQMLRNQQGYENAKQKAHDMSSWANAEGASAMAPRLHAQAANLHRDAAAIEPERGHEEKAEEHDAMHGATKAVDEALHSPHSGEFKHDGIKASSEAYRATKNAHEDGTPEAHGRAAEAHGAAAEKHMEIHGALEDNEEGHHGQIAKKHIDLHAYHSAKSKTKGEVAKAEGCMTSMDGGTDIATKTGGAALAMEGGLRKKKRKDEEVVKAIQEWDTAHRKELAEHKIKGSFAGPHESFPVNSPEDLTHAFMLAHHASDPAAIKAHLREIAKQRGWESHLPADEKPEEVGKAHHEASTRTQGGKLVQVASYDTHQAAAHAASTLAHKATAEVGSRGAEGHTQAAGFHKKATEAHREAAKLAPEEWIKKGHEDQANLHDHYAKAHHAKAKASGQHADTGVNSPGHTTDDIKHLENHEDYQGYGYLGHGSRTPETDKHVAEAANRAGIDKHKVAAHLLSQSGRHMMDDASDIDENDAEGRIAHHQRWMTDAKKEKAYGIKEYAADIKSRAGKEEPKK